VKQDEGKVEQEAAPPSAAEVEKALLPSEIVNELDKFIIGQAEAKKAVSIALRNRWRRRQLPQDLASEIIPKNILMIGPTGVGKTEIARRLAKLAQAPFIKVEATKFTEVGFHGRDVDMIIRDLVDVAVHDFTMKARDQEKQRVKQEVEERLLDILAGQQAQERTKAMFRKMLQDGELEGKKVDVEVPQSSPATQMPFSSEMGAQGVFVQLDKIFGGNKKQKRKMTIAECRPYLEEQEAEKLINKDAIVKTALEAVQSNGIVFIDEIDKICRDKNSYGADASSEGVQRDLLPLIEGTTISTKYGNVDTSKILFVASGAFHSCKPSDLLAELQGRLPIRVQLKPLKRQDYYRILTETKFNQIEQATALLRTEGVELEFTDDAIHEITKVTAEVNETVENIGARRLHTVMERILEEVSYECTPGKVVIDVAEVRKHLSELLLKTDLSRYVL
jgi:ATP-dependent HslUV protease ATP-binding subunit HslU